MLIIYSTTDGQAKKIAEHIQTHLQQNGSEVTLVNIDELDDAELEKHDRILIGASIRYGHHAKPVYELINRQQQLLASKRSAFFSVNLVARKPNKRQPETNPYVKKFLRKIPWQPNLVEVFAGRLDYPLYSFWDRQIIRLIMKITGGPTNPDAVVEYTDWEQVEAFAKQLQQL